MSQRFEVSRNTYVKSDPDGTVRALLHFDAPVEIVATTPQLAAAGHASALTGSTPTAAMTMTRTAGRSVRRALPR